MRDIVRLRRFGSPCFCGSDLKSEFGRYNFGLLLRWLAELLRAIIRAFAETVPAQKIA